MSKFIRTFLSLVMLVALAAPLVRADDDDIYDHVNQKLNADRDIHGRIKIDVKDGVVTLSGMVHDEKVKERATKLTKKVAGVKDVVNKIEIGEEKPPK
jgi:osmotically-inducible protein OsmY